MTIANSQDGANVKYDCGKENTIIWKNFDGEGIFDASLLE